MQYFKGNILDADSRNEPFRTDRVARPFPVYTPAYTTV